MKKNRKKIITPKYYWFSAYDELSGEQFCFTCTASNEKRAIQKFYSVHKGNHYGIADFECFDDCDSN